MQNNSGGYYQQNTWGYNYYGVPYWNPYQYNSINHEISQKVSELEDKAKQSRLELNKNLSRLAHKIEGDGVTEEEITERYEGKSVEVPHAIVPNIRELQDQIRIDNMIPFDNSYYYQQKYAAVSAQHNKYIKPDSNMNNAFDKANLLNIEYEAEEEAHRRKNLAGTYDSNAYRYFVRKEAERRYKKEKGIADYVENPAPQQQQNYQMSQQLLGNFPTLAQNVRMADDGTLNITYNFGSNLGQVYNPIHGSQEAEYEKSREKFAGFLNSIPEDIYGGNK